MPISRDIPRFVADEKYAANFGLEWTAFGPTMLDSYTGRPISRDRLMRTLGGQGLEGLDGQLVLEAGCGSGRFTEVLLQQGSLVTSIDLSRAVEANASNLPVSPQHRVAQADIRELPFRPRSFDMVICIGVLQHLPSPEEAIECLYEQVAPGGLLVLDHYAFALSWYTRTAPLFRSILRRLPPGRSLAIVKWLVSGLLPLHYRVRHRKWIRRVLTRLSPVMSYHVMFPELSAAIQREWAVLDTFDALTERYKHFRSAAQIRHTLERLGAAQIHCENVGGSIIARCVRPVTPQTWTGPAPV